MLFAALMSLCAVPSCNSCKECTELRRLCVTLWPRKKPCRRSRWVENNLCTALVAHFTPLGAQLTGRTLQCQCTVRSAIAASKAAPTANKCLAPHHVPPCRINLQEGFGGVVPILANASRGLPAGHLLPPLHPTQHQHRRPHPVGPPVHHQVANGGGQRRLNLSKNVCFNQAPW